MEVYDFDPKISCVMSRSRNYTIKTCESHLIREDEMSATFISEGKLYIPLSWLKTSEMKISLEKSL
jgi:hypothetical protein